MYCNACGNETPDQRISCTHCGAQINKECPRCAEIVKLNAKVCRFCGYDFASEVSDAPGTVKPSMKYEASTPKASKLVGLLPTSTIGRWRSVLGALPGWEPTRSFDQGVREVLSELNPPFVPEKESLVFDTDIWERGGPRISIVGITYWSKSLREGFFMATESRIIFGNVKHRFAIQIPYSSVQSVSANKDNYTLHLSDNDELTIHTKVPRPSWLGATAVLGGSPMDKANISRMEKEKADNAQGFAAAFAGFFLEIADMNRSVQNG